MAKNKEIGRIGRRQYSGIFYEEFVKELLGTRGIEVYKEMANNDSTIGAVLFACEMLIRQVDFKVNPAGETEADKKAAQFVEECMYDMQDTWSDTISEILSFLTYGWSYHEIVYKVRNGHKKDRGLSSKYDDGLIGWKKMPIRSQDTLYQWEIDEVTDEVTGMTQAPPPNFTHLTIPIEKALHFKTRSAKGNPEGRSILRTCYRDWYFKKRIQEIEGIGVERDLAGLPMITPPEGLDIWDTEDPEMVHALASAQQIVTGVRRDTQEGLVLPYGWTFQLLSTGSRRQFDTNQIIQRYDQQIARSVLADFILLGSQAVGSFALSSDKTQLFSLAIGTYIDVICEVFNNQAIPRLIDINGDNFNGITDYPELAHGDIETPDLNALASFINTMVGAGIITPDEDLENEMRIAANLPEKVDSSDRKNPNDKEEQQSVYKITSLVGKYQKGEITRNMFMSMLKKIGASEQEIEEYLMEADQHKAEKQKEQDAQDAKEAAAAKASLRRNDGEKNVTN